MWLWRVIHGLKWPACNQARRLICRSFLEFWRGKHYHTQQRIASPALHRRFSRRSLGWVEVLDTQDEGGSYITGRNFLRATNSQQTKAKAQQLDEMPKLQFGTEFLHSILFLGAHFPVLV